MVDCVEPNLATGTRWVHFGYVNDGAPQTSISATMNQVIPGFGFQGQPTVFNSGSYPRVFKAVWNQAVFTAIAWDLNGILAVADASTPFCAAGATGPASEVSMSGATLNGIVNPKGSRRPTASSTGRRSRTGRHPGTAVTSGSEGVLVSEPLSGLEPGTTYHYRLVADGTVATVGEDRTLYHRPTPCDPGGGPAAQVDLAAAVARCKRKFSKGSRGRQHCIRKAKRLATWA